MREFAHAVNGRIKDTGSGFALFVFKVLSAFVFGLTFALIGQEMVGYATFSFVFVMMVFGLAFMKLNQNRGFIGVFVFDLVCILVGLLLRMYVLIAPGA